MADAFKDLANTLNSQTLDEAIQLEVAPFSRACTLVSPLFRCLGIAFKFAELDYVAKVILSFPVIDNSIIHYSIRFLIDLFFSEIFLLSSYLMCNYWMEAGKYYSLWTIICFIFYFSKVKVVSFWSYILCCFPVFKFNYWIKLYLWVEIDQIDYQKLKWTDIIKFINLITCLICLLLGGSIIFFGYSYNNILIVLNALYFRMWI